MVEDQGGESMSKEWIFVLTAAAVITSTGLAAGDEYIPPRGAQRAAPPATAPPPFYSWAGPYVGVSGGFVWGHSNQTDPGFFIPTGGGGIIGGLGDGSFSLNGGLIGGGGGYNLQFGQWVFGLETDYSWADISGSSNGCGAAFIPHTCSTQVDSLGTFRGRFGYTLGTQGTWLLYASGGLAYGELKGSDSLFNASGSKFRAGWTVGAGVETALAQHWTLKGEYLYVDLGHAVLFDAAPGVPETISFTGNVFRVGLNYKFF
jgi:opacity protein-like surface antigen